jgi:hypothetical protein
MPQSYRGQLLSNYFAFIGVRNKVVVLTARWPPFPLFPLSLLLGGVNQDGWEEADMWAQPKHSKGNQSIQTFVRFEVLTAANMKMGLSSGLCRNHCPGDGGSKQL